MLPHMRFRLIACDVDGCLSPEASVSWDLDRISTVARRVRGAGPRPPLPFTLCTGRPQPYVEALLKLFAIDLPAICENGAVLYRLATNEAAYAPGVTAERIRAMDEVRRFVVGDLLPAVPGARLQFGKQAQVTLYVPDPGRFRDLAGRIRAFLGRDAAQFVVSSSHLYLNVSLAGVDKGTALAAVCRELGLGRDAVAAIGDTEGDLPMQGHAGFFACPANATAEVRARANYVSPLEEDLGLIDILDHLGAPN
ncbi:MAG: hypothetical protein EA425_04540 [Puniceicoccaceae bacterium]|nr:MAG: hypothetical protein EA425_04540 [Puniceicoccaceae bacterium]